MKNKKAPVTCGKPWSKSTTTFLEASSLLELTATVLQWRSDGKRDTDSRESAGLHDQMGTVTCLDFEASIRKIVASIFLICYGYFRNKCWPWIWPFANSYVVYVLLLRKLKTRYRPILLTFCRHRDDVGMLVNNSKGHEANLYILK